MNTRMSIVAALLLTAVGSSPVHASMRDDAAAAEASGEGSAALSLAGGDILIERGVDANRPGNERLLALLGRVTGGGANAPLSGSVTAGPGSGGTAGSASSVPGLHLSSLIRARAPMTSSYTGLGNSNQLILEALEQSAAYVAASRLVQSASAPGAPLQAIVSTGGGYVAAPSVSVAASSPVAVTTQGAPIPNGGLPQIPVPGDIEQIPVPAAAYLLGSGLLGLAGLRRKLNGSKA